MSTTTDWIAVARELGPSFAEHAAAHDADDSFVAENYSALKERGLFAAGVPGELGGEEKVQLRLSGRLALGLDIDG